MRARENFATSRKYKTTFPLRFEKKQFVREVDIDLKQQASFPLQKQHIWHCGVAFGTAVISLSA